MIGTMPVSKNLEMGAMVAINLESDGFECAVRFGLPATLEGVEMLRIQPNFSHLKVAINGTAAARKSKQYVQQEESKNVINPKPATIDSSVSLRL